MPPDVFADIPLETRKSPVVRPCPENNLISPDAQVRESREKILLKNIGQQIDYVLLSARNVVPSYKNALPKQLQIIPTSDQVEVSMKWLNANSEATQQQL